MERPTLQPERSGIVTTATLPMPMKYNLSGRGGQTTDGPGQLRRKIPIFDLILCIHPHHWDTSRLPPPSTHILSHSAFTDLLPAPLLPPNAQELKQKKMCTDEATVIGRGSGCARASQSYNWYSPNQHRHPPYKMRVMPDATYLFTQRCPSRLLHLIDTTWKKSINNQWNDKLGQKTPIKSPSRHGNPWQETYDDVYYPMEPPPPRPKRSALVTNMDLPMSTPENTTEEDEKYQWNHLNRLTTLRLEPDVTRSYTA